jgi:hypothetical protein
MTMTDTAPTPWTAGEVRRPIAGAGWALEAIDASLDHVSYRGTCILRGLRVIVRDRDWRTVPAVLDALETTVEGSATVVTLSAHHDDLGATAHWTATLRLEEGRLDFEVDLGIDSRFWRNRIGIVALHPTEVAGSPLAVSHPDDTVTETVFPLDVSPHQPALDITGLAWTAGPHDVAMRFFGDVFEMEDQRNWTDASYKTYSTPLSLPFPVEVGPGDRVRQAIAVTVTPATRSSAVSVAAPRGLVADAPRAPRIQVGASTAPGHPSRRPGWLTGAGVLVELDLHDPAWRRALGRARRDAGASPLDVRLVAESPDELDAAVASLRGVPLTRVAVYDSARHITTPELWGRLRDLAHCEPLTGVLVGGTRGHFTELNRTRAELPRDLAGITFSLTPQMHDLSTDQVVESLAELRRVAAQAGRIGGGRPVHVGPVTLRARFNAVATSAAVTASAAPGVPPAALAPDSADPDEHGYAAERMWNSTDPRQQTDEYATWLLAAAIALATGSVESITLAEAWGPRGFGTADGRAFPAAEVLDWLVSVQGADVVPLDADVVPAGVAALAVRAGEKAELLLANASPRVVDVPLLGVTVTLPPWGRARVPVPPPPAA